MAGIKKLGFRVYPKSFWWRVIFHRIVAPQTTKPKFWVTDLSLWAPSTQKRHGIPKYSRSHMPMQQGTSNRVWLKPKEDKHWYHLNFTLVSRNFWKFSAITMQKCTAHFRLRNLWKLYSIILYWKGKVKKKVFSGSFFGQLFLSIYALCERRFQIMIINFFTAIKQTWQVIIEIIVV